MCRRFPFATCRTPGHLEGMVTPSDWPRNRLLRALPATNLKRLMPQLERIPCQSGQILQDADSSLDDVFFPIVVSSRWWRCIRTGIPSKWQPWAERVAQVFKLSSASRSALLDFSSTGNRCKDVARSVHARHEVNAVLSKSDVRLRSNQLNRTACEAYR
jgi:hypothetical protein